MIKEELRIQMAITRSLMFLDDRTKYIRKPYKFSVQKNLYDAYSELLRLCICAKCALAKSQITVSEYDDLINKADKYDKHYD